MKTRVFSWPASNIDGICLPQTFTQNVPLKMNGALNAKYISQGVVPTSIVFDDFSRNISISSDSDLTNINFLVKGSYLGFSGEETIVGPGAGITVSTTNIFDYIEYITPDDNTLVFEASVGLGLEGHTKWYLYSSPSRIHAMTIQVIVDGTIQYSFQATLQDITNSLDFPIVTFDPTGQLTAQTESAFGGVLPIPLRYARVNIDSSDDAGSLKAYFLESDV